MWWGSGLGAFEQPEGTPCWHKARKLLSCGDTASRFLKYLSPNQSGAAKPADIICCRWISDGSCTASWVWHGLIPLVFAGYLPSQQPDICGVNHFQLFHRRKLSSSINNNSSRTWVSEFAWGSETPFRTSPHPRDIFSWRKTGGPCYRPVIGSKKRCQLLFLNFCLCPYISGQYCKQRQKRLVKNNGGKLLVKF